MTPMQHITAQVAYNSHTGEVEVRIPLADGSGDHVLAVLPAIPPPTPLAE